MEVPQFSPVLPTLPDNPRGFSETPMVRVPATASLLRAFQPRSRDSFHSVYSGLRPIYATQSHPKNTSTDTCIAVVWCEAAKRECARAEGVGLGERVARTAKQPQGPAREPKRSEFNYKPEVDFHLTQNGNCHFTLCFQGRGDFHTSKNGEPPRKV